MGDTYRDTEYRMLHDAEFRALVDHIAKAAQRLGFTPGELKQAAFAAAVLVETYSAKPFVTRVSREDGGDNG